MGQLYYGNTDLAVEIADALLAHVKVVTATKLRRGESFTLSWVHPDHAPVGRTTIWLQPAIPLRFVFESAEPEMLDPALLQELVNSANSSGGLSIDIVGAREAARATLPA
ncbi:hypothetical protein [Microbacterium sp. P05]|uniref:DUF7882 family protein n=1 Tax=Microbacterium sp. P05 TaxID=3366948 RepID=UPI0037451407